MGQALTGLRVNEARYFKIKEPEELGAFKFARQKSKLAGTIRGSYVLTKGEH